MQKNSGILNIPNIITITRMLLSIPIVYCLTNDKYACASILFIIAAASDTVDGYLAKKLHQITKFGTILDPVADKILINYTLFIFAVKGIVPQLVFFVVFVKDIVLIIGSTAEIFSQNNPLDTKIKASIFGKISTLFQIMLIAALLLLKLNIYKNNFMLNILVWIVILLSFLALISYVVYSKKHFKGVYG